MGYPPFPPNREVREGDIPSRGRSVASYYDMSDGWLSGLGVGLIAGAIFGAAFVFLLLYR
jgi:hypothetical protein